MNVSTKEILLEVADKLQTAPMLFDAIEEQGFHQGVEERLAELDRGTRTRMEAAESKFAEWAAS